MKTKKKAARTTPAPRWILNEKTAPPIVALGVMAAVILLTLAFNVLIGTKDDDDSPTNTTQQSGLTFTTTDNVDVAAEVLYPAGAGPFPLVILVHEFGQDRNQWDAYREVLIGEGYAVLAYDIRGFGDSALAAVPAEQGAWFASMPNDLRAAVQYAQAQAKINKKNINVMGVGLGANIAYVGSGSIAAIAKTIMISPTINPQLDGSTVDDFFPMNILGIANESERATMEALMQRVTGEKPVIFSSEPGIRGFELLQRAELRARIVNWLRQ